MKSHWNRHMLTLYRRSFDSFQVKNVQYPGTGLIIWFGIRLVSCKARNTPIPGASKNTTYFKWRASMLQHYHHIGTRGNRTNVSYIPLGININVTLALKTSYSTTVSHRKEIEKILQPTWSKHQTKYNNHLRMAHSSTFCTMYVYWCPSRAADTTSTPLLQFAILAGDSRYQAETVKSWKTCNCTKPSAGPKSFQRLNPEYILADFSQCAYRSRAADANTGAQRKNTTPLLTALCRTSGQIVPLA